MPYFKMRDGEEVFAEVLGKGPPCIMLHGLGAQAGSWRPLITSMQDRHRFILMDIRGCGRSFSAVFGGQPVFAQIAEDVDDLMEQLGIDSAKLVGCSLGAYACLVKHKITGLRRISSMLLCEHPHKAVSSPDFAHGINPMVLETYRDLVACQKAHALDNRSTPFDALPARFQRRYKVAFTKTAIVAFTDVPWRRRLIEMLMPMQFQTKGYAITRSWHTWVKILEDYISRDYGIDSRDLARIDMPVTLMFGRRSELFPSAGIRQLAEHMPKARIVAFERSSHAFWMTEPLKFRAEFQRFMDGSSTTTEGQARRAGAALAS